MSEFTECMLIPLTSTKNNLLNKFINIYTNLTFSIHRFCTLPIPALFVFIFNVIFCNCLTMPLQSSETIYQVLIVLMIIIIKMAVNAYRAIASFFQCQCLSGRLYVIPSSKCQQWFQCIVHMLYKEAPRKMYWKMMFFVSLHKGKFSERVKKRIYDRKRISRPYFTAQCTHKKMK